MIMKQDTLRVIHNSPLWLPQTQTWMYNQIKYLPESVEVHVVCESTQNLDQFSVPNIHSLKDISTSQYYWEKGMRKLKFRLSRNYLAKVAKQTKARVIHNHFGDNGWNYLKAVQYTRLKHIVTFYGYDVNMLPSQDKRWIDRYHELFNQADAFLFEGPHMAKQLIEMGCPIHKAIVHHLGVEVNAIPFKPRAWNKREPLRILIAAAFREKKGITYALEALGKFQHVTPIVITMIGDANKEPRNKEEKLKIEQILRKSNLLSKTRLLGYQPYKVLFDEAYNHHIFLSPSVTASDGDTEGGAPVSIIELMATGMPVISTTHCDIPEVVKYGKEDWLVEEREVDGLVDRMVWLVNNTDEWGKMLAFGRAHVENEYSAEVQGIRLAKIYKDIIQ
jgi:colanic acid/amylovoran biosynthesis glycosyltransferase